MGSKASGPGGNILNDYENAASPLTIVNSLITGGTSTDYGGGVGAYGSSVTLRSTTFSGNHAIGGGGAWVGGYRRHGRGRKLDLQQNTTSGFAGGLTVEMFECNGVDQRLDLLRQRGPDRRAVRSPPPSPNRA